MVHATAVFIRSMCTKSWFVSAKYCNDRTIYIIKSSDTRYADYAERIARYVRERSKSGLEHLQE